MNQDEFTCRRFLVAVNALSTVGTVFRTESSTAGEARANAAISNDVTLHLETSAATPDPALAIRQAGHIAESTQRREL